MAIEQAKNSLTGSKGKGWSPLDRMGESPMMNTDKSKAQALGAKGMTTAKGLATHKAKQAESKPKPNRAKTKASSDQVAAFREKQKLSKMNAAERRAYNSPTAKAKRARAARNKG